MKGRKRKNESDSSDLCIDLDSSSNAVLRTEDGGKFKTNKYVLVQQCPFFKSLFCGEFGDGTEVLLKGIDTETLGSILIYLYTGNIQLNKENATDILVASDYLLIDSLIQKSWSYVLAEMTPTNCVPLLLTVGCIERLSIFNECLRFIVVNFEEVLSQSEEIGKLSLEELENFLTEKSLNVSDERTIWNAIVKWIEFDLPVRLQFVLDLLRYISLEDIDETLLSDIYFHRLIRENHFYQELISCESQQTKQLQNFRKLLKSQRNLTESRIPANIHLIIYKYKTYRTFENTTHLTWDDEIDYWQEGNNWQSPFLPDYLIQLDRYVYIFETTIDIRLAIDIVQNKCIPMTPIYKYRSHYSVVFVNGFIYIIGGRGTSWNRIENVERFNPRTWKWELVSSMEPMSFSKAVALNGYIYAIGYDRKLRDPKMMVQLYDPVSDKWSKVSAPSIFKPVITAVAYRDCLYLIGGKTFGSVSRTIKEYDPIKDAWNAMPNLPLTYRCPRAVVFKDVLIVYEERLEYEIGENLPPVYWAPEKRTWHIIPKSSPLRNIRLFKFCTIADSNVVKDIFEKNKQNSKSFARSPFALDDFRKCI